MLHIARSFRVFDLAEEFLGRVLLFSLPAMLRGGGLETPLALRDHLERLIHCEGMADPGDLAFLVDDEGRGDAFLLRGIHPADAHRAPLRHPCL